MAPPLPLVAASPAAFDAMLELSSAKVAPLDWKKIPPAKPAAVELAPALLPDIVVLVSVVDPIEPGCSKIAPPKPPAPGPATLALNVLRETVSAKPVPVWRNNAPPKPDEPLPPPPRMLPSKVLSEIVAEPPEGCAKTAPPKPPELLPPPPRWLSAKRLPAMLRFS